MPFFDLYSQYLEVRGTATTAQELCAWKGHIESRLRKLTKLFEDPAYLDYFEMHLLPRVFYARDEANARYPYCASFFFGVSPNSFQIRTRSSTIVELEMGGRILLTPVLQYFAQQLEGTSPFVCVPDTLGLSIHVQHNNNYFLQMHTKAQIPEKIRCQL